MAPLMNIGNALSASKRNLKARSFVKVKHEELFARLAVDPKNPMVKDGCDCSCCRVERATPTDRGRNQFWEQQSKGITPTEPDDYYLRLIAGKTAFDFLTSEYRQIYLNGEWWGFYLLWQDWEGERWILPLLCAWYPSLTNRSLPSWLGLEISEEERQKMEIK